MDRATELVREAEVVILMLGAGMGVDSGLATFRGGGRAVWQSISSGEDLLGRHGKRYEDLANPDVFEEDAHLAWGFHAASIRAYRQHSSPHMGYQYARRLLDQKNDYFVITSNVDGHLENAGFSMERVLELHGSCRFLQCQNTGKNRDCLDLHPISDVVLPKCDAESGLALDPLPRCKCGLLLRPNVLFFSDLFWVPTITREQHARFESFKGRAKGKRVAIIEIGAGTAVTTVRRWAEGFGKSLNASMVRINPQDCVVDPQDFPAGSAEISLGAEAALRTLWARLQIRKTAIVTGATKGIGRAVARQFVGLGWNVIGTGRSEAGLEELRREGVEPWKMEAGDAEAARGLIDKALALWGRIDCLVSNAGVYPEGQLSQISEAFFDDMMRVNLKDTVFLAKEAASALEKSGAGRIIVISSITGMVTGIRGYSIYGATKAAQVGFVRGLALELAQRRITVNAVLPGNIHTEGLETLCGDDLANMKNHVPVGRLGHVDDIAAAVMFLSRPEASFVTGTTLVVDGGQTITETGY